LGNFHLQGKNLNLINKMGQKSHPYSLKSNFKNSTWSSKYIEKNSSSTSLLVVQDFNISNFLNTFFSMHGLILCNYNLCRTQRNTYIYISYFSTKIASKLFKIKKKRKKKRRRKRNKKRKLFSFKRSGLVLKRKKFLNYKFLNKDIFINRNIFINKITSCLSLYLNHKYNIKVVLNNLNKGLSFRISNKESFLLRKSILKLRFYMRSDFFIESINILLYSVRQKKAAKLLSEFIALRFSVLKKHNFFLTFIRRSLFNLVNSRYSIIKGIKIKIKGRFNGAPRSKTRMFKINNLPSQTFKNALDYYQSVSYNNNGTFGIKVWISY
jgi:ribosomal protein S3